MSRSGAGRSGLALALACALATLVPARASAWTVRSPAPLPAPAAAAWLHSPHDVVESLALSPAYATDRTLYAGLPRFNLLLRSTDAGATWNAANTGLDTAYVLSIAVSPEHAVDDTVWCAEIGGIFRSQDRGAHWQPVAQPAAMRGVTEVMVSPDWEHDATLIALTQRDGVWLGRERGAAWTRVGPGDAAPEFVTAARDEGGGLLLWALDGARLLRARVGRGETAFAEVAADAGLVELGATCLVAEGDGPGAALCAGGTGGLMRSPDGGRTWTRETTPGGPDEVLHLSTARDAVGAALVWAATATSGVLRRGADGAWSASREGFREPTHQTQRHWLATCPSPAYAADRTVWCAAFEGLYVSEDGGGTWRWRNLLQPSLIRNLAFTPDAGKDLGLWIQTYGAGLMTSDDGGRSFRRIDTMDWWFPDGVAVSPDHGRDHTLLVGTPNRLLVSRDGGKSVQVALEAKGFARVLAFAPDWADSGTAYAYLATDTGLATNRFVVTNDRGATWHDSTLRTVYDMDFASDFATSGRMWAGTPDGLFLSEDRGERFARVDALPAAGINSVSLAPGGAASGAEPAAERDVLAVVSRGSGVFLSRDGGASWEHLQEGLSGIRVALVELSPGFARDGTAFLGPMNSGVHKSTDGGRSWRRVEGGPSVALSMALSPRFAEDGTLLVGGYDGAWLGRGAGALWQKLELPLPDGGDAVWSHEPGEGVEPDGTPGAAPRPPAEHDQPPGAPDPEAGDGTVPRDGAATGDDAGRSAREESRLVPVLGGAGAVVAALAALLAARRRALR